MGLPDTNSFSGPLACRLEEAGSFVYQIPIELLPIRVTAVPISDPHLNIPAPNLDHYFRKGKSIRMDPGSALMNNLGMGLLAMKAPYAFTRVAGGG